MPKSFSEWINLLPSFGAILFTAVAVKWLDDFIDGESYTESFRAGAAYSLTAILLAAALEFSLTFALFAACYIIGMFNSLKMRLPSGLPSWAESVIALILAIIFSGFKQVCWALLIIISVQLIDDIMDYKLDQSQNRSNAVLYFGLERSWILFLFCFYLSLKFQPLLSVIVLAAALITGNVLFSKAGGGRSLNATTRCD